MLSLLLCLLFAGLTGCATRVVRQTAGMPTDTRQVPIDSLTRLEEALRTAPLSEDRQYLYLSAYLGLARSAGRFDDADRVLEAFLTTAPETRLARLVELWWGDNALYAGHFPEAERRYREALRWLEAPPARGARSGSDPRLLGYPMWDWLTLQLGTAIALQGRTLEAARFLEAASLSATGLVEPMRSRAAILAWDAGDRALQRRLEVRLSSAHPARSRLSRPPPVRPLEALELKAPWEPGVSQLAGAIGPGRRGVLRYVLGGFRYGRPDSPCGRAAAGYYYDAGSHAGRRAQGRDRYAIDFSAPGRTRTPWGSGSFGIQIRAAGEGIAGMTYYGTRTHRDVWDPGPVPPNNKVLLFHVPPGSSAVDLALGSRHRRRTPGVEYAGLELNDAWDYQTAYHHLVGLEAPCPGDPDRDGPAGRCIPYPALVSPGQYLWRGTPLGYEDSTGLSMIDHLHFQINQSCREGGAPCPRGYRYRRTGRSIPVELEGRRFEARDAGACLESTNHFELARDVDRDGLPDVLEAGSETVPAGR